MKMVKFCLLVSGCLLLGLAAWSQQKDSLLHKQDTVLGSSHKPAPDSTSKKDSADLKKSWVKKKSDPHKATLYSAILPGAGQIYNRKYWKLPIVYLALGIPAYTYFYNKSWYQKCQYALVVQTNGSTGDSLSNVDPKLQYLASQYGSESAANALINYRNEFRKDQDYSALFFLLFWGLQIVDATVDAHLKDFNVNSDLSFRIKPAIFTGTRAAGVSLVFDIHKGKTKLIDIYQ
jgi:hypothetical protein